MYYDKSTKMFEPGGYYDRDPEIVAAKLRLLAENVERNSLGALSLNILGEVFGNEFWNLIYHEPTCTRWQGDDHVD